MNQQEVAADSCQVK